MPNPFDSPNPFKDIGPISVCNINFELLTQNRVNLYIDAEDARTRIRFKLLDLPTIEAATRIVNNLPFDMKITHIVLRESHSQEYALNTGSINPSTAPMRSYFVIGVGHRCHFDEYEILFQEPKRCPCAPRGAQGYFGPRRETWKIKGICINEPFFYMDLEFENGVKVSGTITPEFLRRFKDLTPDSFLVYAHLKDLFALFLPTDDDDEISVSFNPGHVSNLTSELETDRKEAAK